MSQRRSPLPKPLDDGDTPQLTVAPEHSAPEPSAPEPSAADQLARIGDTIALRENAPGWFWHLPPSLLANLGELATSITVPRRSILFSEGQKPDLVYVVSEGRIKLFRGSKQGRIFLVKMAEPGEILGLSAALSATPYELTAEAAENATLLRFHRKDFVAFIRNHIEGSLSAAESLNDEYRSALEDACRLALYNSVPSRLAHLLIAFALENGTAAERQPRIHMPLTHEEIATMLGSTRESVTRALKSFRRKGILSIHGADVTIRRKSALELLL